MASISRRTFAAFLATAALTPVLGGCSSFQRFLRRRRGRHDDRRQHFGTDAAAGAATRTVDTDKGRWRFRPIPRPL